MQPQHTHTQMIKHTSKLVDALLCPSCDVLSPPPSSCSNSRVTNTSASLNFSAPIFTESSFSPSEVICFELSGVESPGSHTEGNGLDSRKLSCSLSPCAAAAEIGVVAFDACCACGEFCCGCDAAVSDRVVIGVSAEIDKGSAVGIGASAVSDTGCAEARVSEARDSRANVGAQTRLLLLALASSCCDRDSLCVCE